MQEAGQTGTKIKTSSLVETRNHQVTENGNDRETSFIVDNTDNQTQTGIRLKHRHGHGNGHGHDNENGHQHHSQEHSHENRRTGGTERHHGRFGRITPSIDRHHHHPASNLINQQKEVIRIGHKQILHADVESDQPQDSELNSYQREVTIGNRRRIIIRRSATLQHQVSVSSSSELKRTKISIRPPGSGSFDEPNRRSVSGRRLLSQDPALSHLVNGDRCETTTTFVSEADVHKSRSKNDRLATPSASSSVIRFDRSFEQNYNSSTDPLMIHVAADPSMSVMMAGGTTPTVMASVPGTTWQNNWHRCRLRFSSCCRATKKILGIEMKPQSPTSGFQNTDLSYRHSEAHRDGDLELMVPPRLQPHCSFGPAEVLFASFRTEGRVTTSCLWHACRVVTIGGILVILGITMAILGYVREQHDNYDLIANGSIPSGNVPGPGQPRQEGFHLNNLSFAGPVVMGVGGFLIVAACVMIFESRDTAAKIVPVSSLMHGPGTENTQGPIKVADSAHFCSSSSQTTFLDRNIVQNLSVAATIGNTDSSSKLSSIGVSCVAGPGSISAANFGSSATMTTMTAGCGLAGPPSYRTAKRVRPKTVPASYTSGSGSAKHSASISHLPEVDSSLPLMDEIGRRALTDAFIHFAKETGRRKRFLYNPAMDAFASPDFRSSCYEDDYDETVRHAIPKCPSAPNIHHHKLYHSSTLPAMTLTLASVSASASSCQSQQVQCPRSTTSVGNRGNVKLSLSPLPPQTSNAHNSSQSLVPSSLSATSHGMYRVLTPTMYRSRMACTRQAVSMDYEDGDRAKIRREGPCIRRDPSPFSRGRPGTFKSRSGRSGDNSLELELGASATRVHQIGTLHLRKACASPSNAEESFSHHTGSSLALDLHVEGGASITLLVRDESRSSRSMASTAQNVTNSVTDSSSQSRDLKEEIAGPITIPEVVTIFENENSSKMDNEMFSKIERENSCKSNCSSNISKNPVESSGSGSLEISKNQILNLRDVIVTIDEDTKDSSTIKSPKTADHSEEDEDSLTLADKMASFEYIDDTDCDAEDDLDWSSFESDNVATPKPHHKVAQLSNCSSPIDSELDVWSPSSHGSDTDLNQGQREAAELERHLCMAAAKHIPARCASAESLSQDLRLASTPIADARMSASKSFSVEMEKKILSAYKDQQKTNFSTTSDAQSQKRDRTDRPSRRDCDAKMRKGNQKQISCDASSAKSPELCSSEPVGVLRRCSTKRYALVRQAKVIGEKQRANFTQNPCQEKENEA